MIAQHCTFRDFNQELDRVARARPPFDLLKFATTLSKRDHRVAKALSLCSTPLQYDYVRRFVDYRILHYIKKRRGIVVKRGYITLKEFEPILEEHLDWLEPDLAILRYNVLNTLEKQQGLPKPSLYLVPFLQPYSEDIDLVLGSLDQDGKLQKFNFERAKRLFSPFKLPLKRWEAKRVVLKHLNPSQFIPMSHFGFSFYLGVNRPYELLEFQLDGSQRKLTDPMFQTTRGEKVVEPERIY